MPPRLDRLVLGLDWIDERARLFLPAAMFWTLLGLSSVYWAVTRTVVLEQSSIISPQLVFEAGWLLTAGSGLFVAGVGVASIILWVIEWMAVRRMPESPTSGATEETPARGESREQVTLRKIFGGFILLVVTRPLALAAINIYQGLASSPVFSPSGVALFALAGDAMIIAAILEGGR